MKSLLFVNGCIREEESRTLVLARQFLNCLEGKYEVSEVSGLSIPLDLGALKKRDQLAAESKWEDPVFDQARRFKEADRISGSPVLGRDISGSGARLSGAGLCYRIYLWLP